MNAQKGLTFKHLECLSLYISEPAFTVPGLFVGRIWVFLNKSESVHSRCNTFLITDVLPVFPRSWVF